MAFRRVAAGACALIGRRVGVGADPTQQMSYSTIAWGATVKRGIQPDVEYGYKANTTAGTIFNFFSALGSVAFAYVGHNVVLEIQATMPSTPEMPSKVPMWKGVIVAYIVVAICYFPVAIIVYWMFGKALIHLLGFSFLPRVAAGASALIGRRLGVGAAPTQQMRGYCQKTLAPEERMSLRSQSVHFFIIGFSGAFFVYAMWLPNTPDIEISSVYGAYV